MKGLVPSLLASLCLFGCKEKKIKPLGNIQNLFETMHEISKIQYKTNGTIWTPEKTLKEKTGDCGEMSWLFKNKLSEKGINVETKSGQLYKSSKSNSHIWCETNFKNEKNDPIRIVYELTTCQIFYMGDLSNSKYIVNSNVNWENLSKKIKEKEKIEKLIALPSPWKINP